MTAPQDQGPDLKALEAYIAYRSIQHSDDQESIAAWLAMSMSPLWGIQRFTQLDESTPLWLAAVLPLVRTAYLQSQRVAAVYAEDVRYAALATEPPLPMAVPDVQQPVAVPHARFATNFVPSVATDGQELVTFDPFPEDDVKTSLVVNGNFQIKHDMPGLEADLMGAGQVNTEGAGVRQAMNGGRNATGQVVRFDRKIIGYARVTDANPCFFCALLASRGASFATGSFNTGGRTRFDGVLTKSDKDFKPPVDGPELPPGFSNVAKVHDHCRCQLRPVYANEKSYGKGYEPSRDAEAQFYFDQWSKVADEWYWLNNRQQLQKFRDQYTPYERKSADVSDIRAELESRVAALDSAGVAPSAPQAAWAHAQISQLA